MNHNKSRQKNRSTLLVTILSVTMFSLVMLVIMFDAVKFLTVPLWALYAFLGPLLLVVYGLLLVANKTDRRLGFRFEFMTMILVVLTSASFTFFGLSQHGDISGLTLVIVLSGMLIFLLAKKRYSHIR